MRRWCCADFDRDIWIRLLERKNSHFCEVDVVFLLSRCNISAFNVCSAPEGCLSLFFFFFFLLFFFFYSIRSTTTTTTTTADWAWNFWRGRKICQNE